MLSFEMRDRGYYNLFNLKLSLIAQLVNLAYFVEFRIIGNYVVVKMEVAAGFYYFYRVLPCTLIAHYKITYFRWKIGIAHNTD